MKENEKNDDHLQSIFILTYRKEERTEIEWKKNKSDLDHHRLFDSKREKYCFNLIALSSMHTVKYNVLNDEKRKKKEQRKKDRRRKKENDCIDR